MSFFSSEHSSSILRFFESRSLLASSSSSSRSSRSEKTWRLYSLKIDTKYKLITTVRPKWRPSQNPNDPLRSQVMCKESGPKFLCKCSQNKKERSQRARTSFTFDFRFHLHLRFNKLVASIFSILQHLLLLQKIREFSHASSLKSSANSSTQKIHGCSKTNFEQGSDVSCSTTRVLCNLAIAHYYSIYLKHRSLVDLNTLTSNDYQWYCQQKSNST